MEGVLVILTNKNGTTGYDKKLETWLGLLRQIRPKIGKTELRLVLSGKAQILDECICDIEQEVHQSATPKSHRWCQHEH